MTNEKVHKFLEVKQREMTQNRHLYNEQAIEINGLAIEALEKQIPKKPIKHYFLDRYCVADYYYQCPTFCNVIFQLSNTYSFCPNCGQALDWSDME